MAEVEIGIGKSARMGYELSDLAIVPSRRTHDPGDVDLSWRLDAFRFEVPVIAAAMDSVVSPSTAATIGSLGGLAPINLEGLWTRYADPEPLFEEIAGLEPSKATARLQEIYAAPIQRDLVVARISEIGTTGAVTAGALSPQRAAELAPAILEAELDVLVIQNTVVSAEHVSKGSDPLNLKSFIRELDIPVVVGGCASYQAALHLMRTGAVGVLVGVGNGAGHEIASVLGIGVPHATAIADAAGARTRHLEETGVYVQLIADGGMRTAGDIAKAIACGADAVMIGAPLAAAVEAPGRGAHWGSQASHPNLPRGTCVHIGTVGSLEEILLGPTDDDDGRCNLVGGLRSAMAFCGYTTVREFHKADVVLAPYGSVNKSRSVLGHGAGRD